MNRFKMFMIGRYGTDQLSIAILVLGMIITFIGKILSSSIISFLSYIPFIICIYRIMSKNIKSRQQENLKFLKVWNKVNTKFQSQKSVLKRDKDYKYFKCPSCKQVVRIPKGKGKIAITCPKCKIKFIKNT